MQDDMKRAVDSLAEVEASDPSIFTASNGLRLKLRRVSQMIMTDAARRLSQPRPPRVFNDDKGREEENPNDPTYIEAVRNYQYDVGMLAINTYFILGTRPIEPLPLEVIPLGSDEWVEMVMSVDPDADIPTTGPRRYLAWLKYHALPDPDQNALLQQCIKFSGGTLEVDVARAQATFRSDATRDTAQRVPATAEGPIGDRTREASGNGTGTGGPGGGDLHAGAVEQVDPVRGW